MKYEDTQIISVATNSLSMAQAAIELGMHFNTFSKHAKRLGVYKPNKGGKGTTKEWMKIRSIPLNEILSGLHPSYQTYKLKQRLYKEGIKQNKCELCGIDGWNGLELECELDHIDGDRTNHSLENLRIICPNCHSQTDTFRAKNIK